MNNSETRDGINVWDLADWVTERIFEIPKLKAYASKEHRKLLSEIVEKNLIKKRNWPLTEKQIGDWIKRNYRELFRDLSLALKGLKNVEENEEENETDCILALLDKLINKYIDVRTEKDYDILYQIVYDMIKKTGNCPSEYNDVIDWCNRNFVEINNIFDEKKEIANEEEELAKNPISTRQMNRLTTYFEDLCIRFVENYSHYEVAPTEDYIFYIDEIKNYISHYYKNITSDIILKCMKEGAKIAHRDNYDWWTREQRKNYRDFKKFLLEQIPVLFV